MSEKVSNFVFMTRLLLFTAALTVLSSCSLEKRLAKYCPLCPTETITEIEYRDTTVEVMVPGDSVKVIDSLYCDSLGNVFSMRLFERDSEILKLKTKLKNNRYVVDCVSDTVVLEKNIPGVTKYIKQTVKVDVPYKPWWMIALSWVGGLFLLAVLLLIALKLLKR